MQFDKIHVLITGAASGIGFAMALQLAAQGCTLELVDQNTEGLRILQNRLTAYPVRVYSHTVDLADDLQIARLWKTLAHAHRKVQVLINNAAVALMGQFGETTAHDFDWLMRINFHAVVCMTRHYLQQHDLQQPGHIVNLSSLFGLIAPPEQTAYAASKFAVRGFSQSLSHELAHTAVRITVAHPGGVATAIAKNARVGPDVPPQKAQRRLDLAQRVLRMSPQKAAHTILQAAQNKRARVVVGWDAKLLDLLERIAPVVHGHLLRAVYRHFK